jgi:hypothetical protein
LVAVAVVVKVLPQHDMVQSVVRAAVPEDMQLLIQAAPEQQGKVTKAVIIIILVLLLIWVAVVAVVAVAQDKMVPMVAQALREMEELEYTTK